MTTFPYFNTNHFGEALTFGSTTVAGIFAEDYVEYSNVAGDKPIFLVKQVDGESLSLGDQAVRQGNTYEIVHKMSDGAELMILVLELQ